MFQRNAASPVRVLSAVMLAAALLVPTVLPSPAFAEPANPFPDDEATPHAPAITALHAQGVARGCNTEGTAFCPTDSIRRDQLASFLVRALDLPSTTKDFFTDDDGNVHEDNINALAAARITHGCGGGSYCPGLATPRDQMASLLVRSVELPSTKRSYFRDVGGTHAYPIRKIAAAGITAGCNAKQTLYCPARPVLRGQMATFLARALGFVERVEIPEYKPKPKPKPAAPTPAELAVKFALSQRGKPYRWGGTGPGSYDCSGLMLSAWRAAGKSLPRTSRAQYSATKRVSRSNLRPGDMVFFGKPVHHVGMYIGDGKMVHSPSSGKRVHVSSIFRRGYVGAGRVR